MDQGPCIRVCFMSYASAAAVTYAGHFAIQVFTREGPKLNMRGLLRVLPRSARVAQWKKSQRPAGEQQRLCSAAFYAGIH